MIKKIQILCMTALALIFMAAPMHAEDLTMDLCKSKAKAAAALLQAEGEAALPKIKDLKGAFNFANGDGYVWVHNLEGIMLMHPIKPTLDGKSVLSMRDINGVYLFTAMNELVEKKGEGWVPYVWPKPGEEKSSPKVSYVVLVKKDGKSYVAGAGMYDATTADITAKFPTDAIYKAE
jgi:signal transduction histidine kinase